MPGSGPGLSRSADLSYVFVIAFFNSKSGINGAAQWVLYENGEKTVAINPAADRDELKGNNEQEKKDI